VRGPPESKNRKGTCSKSEPRSSWAGVDRLSLSFPVEVAEGNDSAWGRYSVTDPGYASERHSWGAQVECTGGGSVYVGVMTMLGEVRHRQWARSNTTRREFSTRTVGTWLVSMKHCPQSVCATWAVGHLMRPVEANPFGWHVKRLDVAKDFDDVEHPSELIRRLGLLPRRWCRMNATYADPKGNGAQTLYVGSGAGGVRLYNKHDETRGDAPEGTVRWETEARAWARRYGEISFLGDVSVESVERLAQDRWEWSHIGAEIAESIGRLVKVVSQSGLSQAQENSFIGWLVKQAAGVDCSDTSRGHLGQVPQALAKLELGIAAPADLGSMVEVVRRLDWESGREVVGIKAV
jgi:hypothetical protein